MGNLKRINDEGYISGFFTNMSRKKEIAVSIIYKGSQIDGVMYFSGRRGAEPSIRTADISLEFQVGETIEVTFYNSEVLFFFQAEITSIFKNTCTIKKPSILFSSFRRLMSRYAIRDDEEVYLEIHPQKRHRVYDISSTGLSFISPNQNYSVNQVVRDIFVKFKNNKNVYIDGVIKNVRTGRDGNYIFGMSFSNVDLNAHNTIFSNTFDKIHPKLKMLDNVSIQDILNIYEKSNFINILYKHKRNISDYFDVHYGNFAQISSKNVISSGLIYYKNDRFLSMGLLFRMYSRTFLGHQVISLPETKINPKPVNEVQSGLCDFMINHPYFHYHITYLYADLTRTLDYYRSIENIINDSSKFYVDTIQCLECTCSEYAFKEEPEGCECVVLDDAKEFIEFCEINLTYLERMSYSYNQNDFDLSEIQQIMNSIGIDSYRRVWRISDCGNTVAYAVAENYTSCVNLLNPLDICRIYFASEAFDLEKILFALTPAVISFYTKYGKDNFFIQLKVWMQVAKDIKMPGLEYRCPVGRVISDKAGMIEYKKYLNGEMVSSPRLYNLTHPQLAIWYTEKVHPGTNFANIAEVVRIKEGIDRNLLERAINHVIQSNDGLRLRITEVEGSPKQYVSRFRYSRIDYFDFSLLGGEEGLRNWDEYKNCSEFNLFDSDLFYFAIFKIDENNGGFYIKTHHLISDAWTIANLLISKIMEYYFELKKNNKLIKIKNNPSYIDFILSENEYLLSDFLKQHREFWKNKFETIPELMCLKPAVSNSRGIIAKRKTFSITKEMTSNIIEFCKETGNSPFTLFLSILSVYFNRITLKNDMVLGTPVLNRSNKREKETVGMFISIVPLRINLNSEMSFKEHINTINAKWKQVLKNQKYPYDLMLNDFREKHNTNENIYDVILSFQNAKHEKNEIEYSAEWVFNKCQTDSLAIHIADRGDEGHFTFDFDYQINKFSDEEIGKIYEYSINLLNNAIKEPDKPIKNLEMLSDFEKDILLNKFNNTEKAYPHIKTIHELFEEQAGKTPNSTAIVCNSKSLTYRELTEYSNQIARFLIEKGIARDSVVGIMIDGSFEMFIGILGILKSGGAYLPIDPGYPIDRIQYMINDSKIRILLTKKKYLRDEIQVEEIIDLENTDFSAIDKKEIENKAGLTDLAYIIYTSGSTGNPKGVMIEHKALVNLCYWHNEYYQITENDRATKYAGFGFDASVWEIFPYLIAGASIYVVDSAIKLDMKRLNHFYEENKISISFLPTQICEQFLLEDNKSLRKLLTGGDKLKNFRPQRYDLVNNYGPTENTVVSTSFVTSRAYANIPIGRPIYNTKIYIVDTNNNIQPIGAEGEICISGAGLARGYLNKTDITSEKFVSNPFVPNTIMYKTGDLGKWLPDGNIEFLGRIDHQIKIRGLRIELGEIENVLLSHKNITEAVVLVKEDSSSNKYLCAYIIANAELTVQDIRNHLGRKLPEYMIPSSYVQLERMPLTANGKVDNKTLAGMEDNIVLGVDYIPPETDNEKVLAEIMKEALEVDRIGINDNFFELGADSLMLIRISAIISQKNLSISMQDFYQYPTIKALCENMNRFEQKNDNIKKNPIESIHNETAQNINAIDLSIDKKSASNVLLTGATGFLGCHLLNELIQSADINIYCIIRGENKSDSRERLEKSIQFYFPEGLREHIDRRIFVLNGDVTEEELGISGEDYFNLIKKIDTIYHCAALVKHYGHYSEFEKINIHGTENIIKFANKGNMKINYISTVSVSGDLFDQRDTNLTFTENDLFIGQNYDDNVYIKSKIEAERMLLEEKNKNLDISIYRVGNLTGRYSDGCFQLNISENRFYNILKTIIVTGAISEEMLEISFEFTPVDYCAKAVAGLSKYSAADNKIYHVFNHKALRMYKILEIFDIMGTKIKVMSTNKYNRYIKSLLKQGRYGFILQGFIGSAGKEKNANLRSTVKVSSELTLNYLNHIGFTWPDINKEYIAKIIHHMKKVNFLSFD